MTDSNAPGSKCAGLHILVVDDEEPIRLAFRTSLESAHYRVVTAATLHDALGETVRHAFDLIFLSVCVGTDNGLDCISALLQDNPWTRVVVITAPGSIAMAVEAMNRGATDYLPKPFEHTQLLLLTEKVARHRQLQRNGDALQRTVGTLVQEWDLPTVSPAQQRALEMARRVASSNAAVLICGEAGTGRSRLARAIHAWSHRSTQPFVQVAIQSDRPAAITHDLFGDGRDATGAVALAHGGTLLLDDIARLPLAVQPAVVALLRDKEFEDPQRLRRRPIDVRIIATSDIDLAPLVTAGHFRADLADTLGIIRINVPPLRDRGEDIPLLADRYLAHFNREHHRRMVGITADAHFVLRTYDWPGNTAELRNVIERAVLLCDGGEIDMKHLPRELMTGKLHEAAAGASHKVGDLVPMDVIEEAHIRQVLASAGTLRRTAAILKLNPSTLFRKLRRYRAVGHEL